MIYTLLTSLNLITHIPPHSTLTMNLLSMGIIIGFRGFLKLLVAQYGIQGYDRKIQEFVGIEIRYITQPGLNKNFSGGWICWI